MNSYCVGTRRKAQLDREQIDQCRRILDSDLVTNFETRMVAEVNLYWIIYESCSRGSVDVPGTQSRLSAWKNEWKFLFGRFVVLSPINMLIKYQISHDHSSYRWDFTLHNC